MLNRKRRRVSAEFSMASMTDMIFLLLIFFMITSTIVVPNAIKVVLPQSNQQVHIKTLFRVIIDKSINYYIAFGSQKERKVNFGDIIPFVQSLQKRNNNRETYIALYADEIIPYAEIVKILNLFNQKYIKVILVARRPL